MLTFVYYFSLAVPILTTLWAALDSRRYQVGTDAQPYSAKNGALVWLLACALIWIVAFPLYLGRRASVVGSKRGSLLGAALVLIYVLLVGASMLGKLPLTTGDVRQVAVKSMTETLAAKNIQLQSLSLEYVEGDLYKGVATLSAGKERQEIPVEVHCKDGQVSWQIRKPQ